jgi:hypothetical protein
MEFQTPPQAAQPWVYWFWLNSNITKEGITADLEAMKRAGIGGVLIMEVDQGVPVGNVPFAGPKWLELFKFACSEAERLGIEINMNNDAGWNGSGGPWVKPEQSMQKIVWTEKEVTGPATFNEQLAQPETVADYYEDIIVQAFPTPKGKGRISNLGNKSALLSSDQAIPAPAYWPDTPAQDAIASTEVITLTSKMDKDGRLTWDVPPGKWTIVRFGHTSTGKENHPTPASGCGLECNKMSTEAAEAHFAGLMGKILKEVGPLAGKSLVATHIDSWENGSNNWSPKFREEFKARRGYDLMTYLPVMTGRIVETREKSERFLWDIRQTVNELVLQNYARHFREMAHRHGLRLTIEAYTWCPIDELAYGGCADEPMGEFWSWWFGTNKKYGFSFACTQAASCAHVYGKKIVGAEAFTACDSERWLGHPAIIKDLGDWAFCEGINRFVFHRYAMQPWLNVKPGMTMGPWGMHYERTETWWEMSKAWHEYLARCQYLLRKGLFVGDVCYLSPEASPQSLIGQKRFLAKTPDPLDPMNADYPRDRLDYSFDVCSAEALLERMSVKDGLLTLPDGMSYRLLVLPNVDTMTPKLLGKVKELIEGGATVVGSRPSKSPSLRDYPKCDEQVQSLAQSIWGVGDAPAELTERTVGKGRIFWSAAFQKKPLVQPKSREQLQSAQWIWSNEGNPAAAAPAGTRYFKKSFDLKGEVKSAQLTITADNEFSAWLNGNSAGRGATHTRTYTFDIAHFLKQGVNIIAVEATNTTDAPSPAGLICAMAIEFKDGSKTMIVSDESWQASQKAGDKWFESSETGEGWSAAKELGPLGMGPWGEIDARPPNNEIYPEVDLVTEVLKKMNVRPDFTYQTASGTKSLRYIHRREEGKDVYFVANKSPKTESAICEFRVEGKQPEFWWPDSGKIERPAVFEVGQGFVRVPMTFEQVGSVFVVFREKATPVLTAVTGMGADAKGNFLDTGVQATLNAGGRIEIQAEKPGKFILTYPDGKTAQIEIPKAAAAIELNNDWDVSFDPKDGGPEKIKFEKLISWPDHADPGVKYYSGTATYTKTVNVPKEQIAKDRRFYLDLGKVEIMAEVKLNGKSLGILWKPPYRVEITDALQPGVNTLEVQVVNLPINRQIGDEFLPEDSERNPDGTLKQWPQWVLDGKQSPTGRKTFAAWRLWKKDDPLQPSGLIGPVQIISNGCVEVNK